MSTLSIAQPFLNWLNLKLVRAKRMMFLSSTAALSRNCDRRGEAAVAQRINEIFHLCENTSADPSRFPYRVSKIIWRDRVIYKRELDAVVHETDEVLKREHAIGYVKNAPKWLKYASEQEMATDVIVLLRGTQDLIR